MLYYINVILFVYGKEKQFCYVNGVGVLIVKSAASGGRVQCSFLSDRSLSIHFPLKCSVFFS